MRACRIIAVVFACWLMAGAIPAAQRAKPPDTSLDAVVAAAAAYVRDYQTALTSVLAQEVYQQNVRFDHAQAERLVLTGPLTREMKSEVFFAFAPASHEWMAIRDVSEVDGQPLENHQDMQTVLASGSTAEVAQKLKTYNSRFNIGDILRNFNEPTMSLLLFDDRYRSGVSFKRKSVERTADAVLVTVECAEKKEPTLIHDSWARPLFAHGSFQIEAGSGRIRRADLQATLNVVLENRLLNMMSDNTRAQLAQEADADPMKFDLTTTYGADAHLGIWMPVHFSERYDAPAAGGREIISGEAVYSDFRRFGAKVIIK